MLSRGFRCPIGFTSGEERFHEIVGGELDQVVHLFADTDEANRNLQIFCDRRDHSAFGGAVELGQNQTGHPRAFREFARLRQAVLTGRGIHDQQHFVRRAGNFAFGDARHLFQFGHQVVFRVQPAGGIDDDVVDLSRLCRLKRIEKNGGRIGVRLLFDDRHIARAAQISSCSMAAARNVSAAHSMTFLPSVLKRLASLPIVVVLPTPLTPTIRITNGLPSAICVGGL